MTDQEVIVQVLGLTGSWSERAVAELLADQDWDGLRKDGPIMVLDGPQAVVYAYEGEVCLEITFALWDPDRQDDDGEEIDREDLYRFSAQRVDQLRAAFDEVAGESWTGDAAQPSPFDEDGYSDEFAWGTGGMTAVVGTRQEDNGLPIRAVLRVYNAV